MADKHLFSTTLELKDHLPMIATDSDLLEQILMFIGDAEREFLVPIVGQTQFDAINDAYDNGAGTPDATETALLNELRRPLAAYAMMKYIPHGQVLISTSGIRINNTDTHKTAFKWQIDSLIEEYLELASNRKENLIKWLFARLGTYTVYAASDEFKNNHQFILSYASEMNENHSIRLSRAVYDQCIPAIRDLELMQVKRAVGDDYYDELITKLRANALTADDKIIVKWLQAAVTKLAVAEAVKRNIARLTGQGVLTFSQNSSFAGGEKIMAAAMDNDKNAMIRSAELWGNAYISKVRDYLNAEASDSKYATYFNGDEYVSPDTTDPESEDYVAPAFSNDMEGAKIFSV